MASNSRAGSSPARGTKNRVSAKCQSETHSSKNQGEYFHQAKYSPCFFSSRLVLAFALNLFRYTTSYQNNPTLFFSSRLVLALALNLFVTSNYIKKTTHPFSSPLAPILALTLPHSLKNHSQHHIRQRTHLLPHQSPTKTNLS